METKNLVENTQLENDSDKSNSRHLEIENDNETGNQEEVQIPVPNHEKIKLNKVKHIRKTDRKYRNKIMNVKEKRARQSYRYSRYSKPMINKNNLTMYGNSQYNRPNDIRVKN
jgi:hypothetical protein